jgi:hypothetical protein
VFWLIAIALISSKVYDVITVLTNYLYDTVTGPTL